jgi:hypothetical protein
MGEQERPAYKLRGSDLNPFGGMRRYVERNREEWRAGIRRVVMRKQFLAFYNAVVMVGGPIILAASALKGLELLLN